MLDAQYDLTAIGRPYTDIIVHVDEGIVRNFGLEKGRIREISSAMMLAIRSELTDYTIYPGGSPPNTCACVQALGGQAVFLGKVCDDVSGRAFRKGFPPGDVLFPNENYPADASALSGTCLVLITPDDVGTVVNCPGVGDRLSDADMFPDLIRDSKILYLQAHFLFADTSRDAVAKAIEVAKSARREVAISLHDHRMNAERMAIFKDRYLPMTDMLIGNREEFEPLFSQSDMDGAASGATLVVMTDGANGAYLVGRDDQLHIPPHLLKARDNTVGAGDAFAAGLFHGYVNGLSLMNCGQLGAEAASAILDLPGARPVSSWKDMADKYLQAAPASLRRPVTSGQTQP